VALGDVRRDLDYRMSGMLEDFRSTGT
jgi:hypothetical protein